VHRLPEAVALGNAIDDETVGEAEPGREPYSYPATADTSLRLPMLSGVRLRAVRGRLVPSARPCRIGVC